MTFSAPEENTLGVVITRGRKPVKQPRRSGTIANSAHRASLGVGFLGLGAAIVVALRAIYGASWFVALWGGDIYPTPLAALAAWIVLVAVLIGAVIASRLSNDRLPDWVFALFLTGLAVSVALDLIAIWELQNVGRFATAAIAAGMTLARGRHRARADRDPRCRRSSRRWTGGRDVSRRPGWRFYRWRVDRAPDHRDRVCRSPGAIIGVAIVESFRRMVQVELDRVLTQSTVSAPRFAVGMLASEELARLDLAAEELLESIAKKKTPLPLAPKMASVAASLATELRLHLIEGRRETWLYHAVSESEMLGKSVTLIDKSSLAGLLDPHQRDGLLATAWLLVSDTTKANPATTVTLQLGPVTPSEGRRRRSQVADSDHDHHDRRSAESCRSDDLGRHRPGRALL